MGKRKVAALEKIDADLANLQHKIRRDPQSYKQDFENQYLTYGNQLSLFIQNPSSGNNNGIISLRDLIDFIAHVADCYPAETAEFPDQLIGLLTLHHESLEPELREKVVGSLVLLRKKEIVDSSVLLNTLFPILISTSSKTLRSLLLQKILSDLRNSNSKTTNHRLNRTMQTVMFNLVTSDRSSPKALWAVKITRELWKRQIWTDSKTVEIMKEASLADNNKVVTGAVRFFLGGDKEREEAADDSSDEEEIDMRQLRHQVGINKKTKKKERGLKKAAATVKKKERKRNQPHLLNFSAFHLLHDPQGFAESLFSKHLQNSKSTLKLEQKLLVLQLVSRLVGLHKLTIISLYSYFLKYLTPRQPSVTSFLASLAQSTHNFVPPDSLEPLIQKIANEFVSEAVAAEVVSAGLNAIREICARQPLAMNETLLQDLVMYRKSKDKGVMMAAKGLLSLYRDVGADMLKKRDRGKEAALGLRSGEKKEKRYGEEEVGQIEGLELLEKWKDEERRKKRIEIGLPPEAEEGEDVEEEEEDWGAWDVEEDESDDSRGWIDVQSDGEGIDISDSEDEKRPSKKTKVDEAKSEKENQSAGETDNPTKVSTLATTRILTPTDLVKLQELRLQSSVSCLLPSNRRKASNTTVRHTDDPLTAAEIEGLAALSHKATREEKIARAKGDKVEKHSSTTSIRKEKKREQGKSTTNKEKERQKNFLMTLGKAKKKGKRSVVETRKILRGHVERQKKGGRRGNR
ncbi:SDA1 domain-containing protein [Patellaria atrata CBS 101060]|uniref:Protein SDA1 n=1 Tax=Patellaria atrata CBS 101060 TaxID=1346257 RepID=A0A9P4VU35_9PEZI|nr:SDA1 domain-containing protein [Patellaria atrata CBS 101060]